MTESKPEPSIHPIFLLLGIAGIGGALAAIERNNAELLPWIFAAGLAGTVMRFWAISGGDSEPAGAAGVDHLTLHDADFQYYSQWLKANIRGQDAVIDAVVTTLQRGLKLSKAGRSLGSFLLVGPTGTGKTFLALMTAKALWPEREPLVLRMNQYKSPSDVNAIMGWSGAGAGGAGELTRAVAENPHLVVLLDEIDKCHPEVLHGLFDALDGGQCRDKATGGIVDFSGCVFFATCNAGVERLRLIAGADPRSYAAQARDVLVGEAGFDKSFLARFTEILLMDSLSPTNVAEIACLLIEKQWREQGVEVAYIAPELLAQAVKLNEEFGQYGVRQLAHCVQRLTDGMLDSARRNGLRRAGLIVDALGAPRLVDAATLPAAAP